MKLIKDLRLMDRLAEKASIWFGSTAFIIFHFLWFGAWYPLGGKTDTLTLIVSLEAIFLSLFILRAENIQNAREEKKLDKIKRDVKRS